MECGNDVFACSNQAEVDGISWYSLGRRRHHRVPGQAGLMFDPRPGRWQEQVTDHQITRNHGCEYPRIPEGVVRALKNQN
jgi:hypothetical protein